MTDRETAANPARDLHQVVEELLRTTGSERYTALPVCTPVGVS